MLKVKTTDGDGRKVMNIHHMNQIYKNINTCKLDRFSPIYTWYPCYDNVERIKIVNFYNYCKNTGNDIRAIFYMYVHVVKSRFTYICRH